MNKKEYLKEYYEAHKEEIRIYNKKYREENAEEINKKRKEYRKINKEKIKESRKSNKEKYYSQRNKRQREKRKIPIEKINHTFSNAIRRSLKGNKNGLHWEEIVGYTYSQLLEHLENISNYSIKDYYNRNLHIDHIIPKSIYNYTSYEDEEFKKCWNYRNLRLVEADENINKYNKLDMDLVKKYQIEDLLPNKK